MRNSSWLVWSLPLMSLLALVAQGAQHNLKFIDQSGRPISDVIVRTTWTATGPYPTPGGTFEIKSDIDGRLTIAHPCGISSGSCCVLVSEVSYQVVGKFGYNISASGTVPCGVAPAMDMTIVGSGQEYPRLTAVSAANYREPLASEMIVSAFGNNLATSTATADLPTPTALGGRQVYLRDSEGRERTAPLLFVSPTQINFIMPYEGLDALRTVIVRDENNQVVSVAFPTLIPVSPGIFTANTDGRGVPAAVIVRVRADGAQVYEPVMQFDEAQRKFVPLALDLGTESEIIILALFGTGWRYASSSASYQVKVKIGGLDCPVEYVGRQPTIEGLDQINVRLPRALLGKGDATVEVQFGSVPANPVQIKIK